MQTFLPYISFLLSAECLDWRRLGKQRVECKQILRALGVQVGEKPLEPSTWRNHPAVRMWRGYEIMLLDYAIHICDEWIKRGYNDSLLPEFILAMNNHKGNSERPSWLGDEEFHKSHRSNLVRKMPEHYGPMWPNIPANLPYIWPV